MPTAAVVGKLTAGSVHVSLHVNGLAVNGSLCNDDAGIAVEVVLGIVVIAVQREAQGDGFRTVSQRHLIGSILGSQCHISLRSNLLTDSVGLGAVAPACQCLAFCIEGVVLRSVELTSSLNLLSCGGNTCSFTGSEGDVILRYLCGDVGRVDSLHGEVGVVVGLAEVQGSSLVGAIVSHYHVVVVARPLGTCRVELGNLSASSVGDYDIVTEVVGSVGNLYAALNGNAGSEVRPAIVAAMPVALQRSVCLLSTGSLADCAVFSHLNIYVASCSQRLQLCQVSLDVTESTCRFVTASCTFVSSKHNLVVSKILGILCVCAHASGDNHLTSGNCDVGGSNSLITLHCTLAIVRTVDVEIAALCFFSSVASIRVGHGQLACYFCFEHNFRALEVFAVTNSVFTSHRELLSIAKVCSYRLAISVVDSIREYKLFFLCRFRISSKLDLISTEFRPVPRSTFCYVNLCIECQGCNSDREVCTACIVLTVNGSGGKLDAGCANSLWGDFTSLVNTDNIIVIGKPLHRQTVKTTLVVYDNLRSLGCVDAALCERECCVNSLTASAGLCQYDFDRINRSFGTTSNFDSHFICSPSLNLARRFNATTGMSNGLGIATTHCNSVGPASSRVLDKYLKLRDAFDINSHFASLGHVEEITRDTAIRLVCCPFVCRVHRYVICCLNVHLGKFNRLCLIRGLKSRSKDKTHNTKKTHHQKR